MAEQDKNIDIIIISYKNPELTIQCVESIVRFVKIPHCITIIDNFSDNGTVEIIKNKFPELHVIINSGNLGYASAVNLGFANTKNHYVLVCNNDLIFHEGTVEILINTLLSNTNYAVVGAQQVYADGSWEYSFGQIPGLTLAIKDLFLINNISNFLRKSLWKFLKIDRLIRKVEYIDGALMAIRRTAYNDVSGFDTDYPFYSEEMDFCFRLTQRGWWAVFNPKATVTHLRGGDGNSHLVDSSISKMTQSKLLFCKKHLSRAETKIFFKLEKIHSLLLYKSMELIRNIFPKPIKYKLEKQSQVFKSYYESYNLVCKELNERI